MSITVFVTSCLKFRNTKQIVKFVLKVVLVCNGALTSHSSFADQVRPALEGLDVVENDLQYSVFVSALKHSGLWLAIKAEKDMTIFLPDNDALDAEGSRFLLESVLVSEGNEQRLIDVLSQHLVRVKIDLQANATTSDMLASYDGSCLDWNLESNRIGLGAIMTGSLDVGRAMVVFVDRMVAKAWDDDRKCDA